MITKCDFPGCEKAGVCKAPKNRDLRDYWHFCKEHAAQYNKNWNYYSGMSPEEIEDDWEKQIYGESKKSNQKNNDDYVKFINDFLNSRGKFDASTVRKTLPGKITSALGTLGLAVTATKAEVMAAYRKLAKKYHPDTATEKSGDKFAKISDAYRTLLEHFKKS